MNSRRILIARIGAMGDVLHALPAVSALRQQWPEAEIDWAVDTRWAPLLVDGDAGGPIVSRALLADTRAWSQAPFSWSTATSILRLRRHLREKRYDFVVDLQGTLRSAVIGHFAAGRSLVGFADPREAAARWLYGQTVERRGTHVVAQGAALLGSALGLHLDPIAPQLPRDPAADAWAHLLVAGRRRVALLAPTAGWGAKQWPVEHFASLARALSKAGWRVMSNAGGAKNTLGTGVVEASKGSATLVSSTLSELIALLRRTDVLVGGDSGPVHLAAALGTPLVALFGPTDPARNGPWGPGPKVVLRDPHSVTNYKHVATVDPGLERINAEQVLEAVTAVTAG